ncbi:glutamine synthetase family protein [Rhizobium sp. TRM95796]|uniref:glutamine synthetase family protein n=1 Tax=Rhizobium sp. TRM95796 TaxID=2979862 RepID=UPI0021E83FED|nr:glutamine synthetase family protein [Rhizobium sp. TRM95796]MCV3765724.1 glutamine synthetase family protein [Rhizobium sp. TRM95796]
MNAKLPPLAVIATTDISGVTRGRPVRLDRLEDYAAAGVGWVPANISLTAFNAIADPNPWGSQGDLRLLPDLGAVFTTSGTGAATPFALVAGDIVRLDGRPWSCCSRTILKQAIADLEAETGLRLLATFELEFQIFGADLPEAHAFSVGALRRADPFASEVLAALEEAGVEPEMFLAEYGEDQFEITLAPADALAAADRAVAVREIIREVARNKGWQASFSPKTSLDGVGNGVHIHFSLRDGQDQPAGYDPAQPGCLSAAAGAFCAGILSHLPALTAITAPSIPSYYRLQPHYWSAAWTWLGERDREASLRICPIAGLSGKDPARQHNIEYRAADSTANPYLSLAGLIRAGLEGIRRKLPAPPIFSGDPALLTEGERTELGLRRLPETLEQALAAFEADDRVCGWFDSVFIETYLGVRRQEMKILASSEADEICARYRTLF